MITVLTRWLALAGLAMLLSGAMPTGARAQALLLSCSVSMTDIAFGSFDVLPGASISSNSTLSISCTGVPLGSGNIHVCVAIPPRSMTGSSSSLAYDIYGPTPATTPWSNTTAILVPFSLLQLNPKANVNVQSAVLGSQQSKPPGSYAQTLMATASYGLNSCTSGSPATSNFTFHATATVVKSCNVSASNLSFGSVTNLDAAVDGQSSLSLQCSNGTGYMISLDGGLSGASDPTARKMTSGSERVTYGLYQNSARSLPWGIASALGGTGTSSVQSIPVYGRVPIQATPSIGTYSDTIVATVTY